MLKLKTPKVFFLLSIVFAVGLGQHAQAQIMIDSFTPQVNDRFANDSSFILDGFDLSGVGRTNGNGFRWATAISSNVVVSAYHARPADGDTVVFNTTNDPDGPTVSRTIASSVRVTNSTAGVGSDLWLGVLDSNLPGTVSPFDFLQNGLSANPPTGASSFGGASIAPLAGVAPGLAGQPIAHFFGRSPSDVNSGQAVGSNRITAFFEDALFLTGETDFLFSLQDDPGEPFFVPSEAFLRSGDSGGPVFLQNGSELALLGTNAFIVEDDTTTAIIEPEGNGVSFLGNEAAFINNFIAVNAVPEPSSALALSAMLGGFLMRRRRAS